MSREAEPKCFSAGSDAKSAANGGVVEVIQELNVRNGHGCCHAIEEGNTASEGIVATKRFERISREIMHQHIQEESVRKMLRTISLSPDLAGTVDPINMTC